MINLSACELMVLIKFKIDNLDESRHEGNVASMRRESANRINELINYLENLRHEIENGNDSINYHINPK